MMNLSEQQVKLIETTFKALGGKGQLFIEGFYKKVFATSPEIASMFSDTEWHQQRSKVMLTLIMIVDNLHDKTHIEAMLEKTIQTHHKYPIEEKHYELMATAILQTFAEILEDEWSDDAKIAWQLALDDINRILQASSE